MLQAKLSPVAVSLALLLGPIVTRADVEEDARAQFDRGMELYDAGQCEEAAIAFERAYELKPSYKILYNSAQAENECGNYARALEVYRRYLDEGGDEISTERIAQVRTEIERLETLVGALVVNCDEAGAVVMVDGRRVGETPLAGPVTVRLGEREVVVKLDGREIHREVVRVAGGEQVEIRVAAAGGEPEPEPGPDGGEQQGPKRVWTWVFLGVGAAAGITGGVIGGVSLKQTDDFIGECGDHSCDTSRESERDDIKRLSLSADILYGVAGAMVLTGVILFFVEPGDEGEEQVALTPAVQPGGAGVALTGRF